MTENKILDELLSILQDRYKNVKFTKIYKKDEGLFRIYVDNWKVYISKKFNTLIGKCLYKYFKEKGKIDFYFIYEEGGINEEI